MGLSKTSISNPERRDRLLLINMLAVLVLTLLGAVGEKLGLDRYLKKLTQLSTAQCPYLGRDVIIMIRLF